MTEDLKQLFAAIMGGLTSSKKEDDTTPIDIQAWLKKRRDEWETESFHNVHTRKVRWDDCAQIGHGFCGLCPGCRHGLKCFTKAIR
jgi:hypothetical protein